ncbi:MAG: arsenate reductase [Staphylococcus epidermidis]|nr:arsenate reductase [Staphylococcus epidermidis]
MQKKTIYFICTGNSCRSQMAEGFGKLILGDKWNVYSAGIETHGVNPHAIKAMKEVGIDISHHTSDLPVLPKNVTKEHWGFDDPAGKDWSEFQRVRDEIKAAIEIFAHRV